MGNDALRRTARGMAQSVDDRLWDLENRPVYIPKKFGGTTAERDEYYGIPTGAASRLALANKQPRWFNSDLGYEQRYYIATGTTGLLVPGMYGGLPAGWYSAPAMEWAVLAGPLAHVGGPGGPYATTWSKGVQSPGATLNPFNTNAGSTLGITIGMTGQYQCVSRQRAAQANVYQTLAINGNRDTIEQRADGVFDHDHAAIADGFSLSNYIGRLVAGEVVTMGPPAGQGATMRFGSASIYGSLTVRRIS